MIHIKAKDIKDCDECPLYGNDCCGNWTSNGAGNPVEPPCCLWDDEEEIYKEMYSSRPEIDDGSLYRKNMLRNEELQRQEKERKRFNYECLRNKVMAKTKYGSSPIADRGYIKDCWYCHHCRNWVLPRSEMWGNGMGEARCPICYTLMVHCREVEEYESDTDNYN